MKLNTLSRLTALLLTMLFLTTSVAMAADPVAEEDYTIYNYAAQLAAETGTCSICVVQTDFPMVDPDGNTITITCAYEYLLSFDTVTARYEYLQWLDLNGTSAEMAAIKQAHYDHTVAGDVALICPESDSCVSGGIYIAPGKTHSTTCPWYCDPVTTTPDVSTFEALQAAVTAATSSIELTYTVDGATSYTWQYTVTPADETSWDEYTNGSTIELTPSALTYAYRCVAVAEDGTITAASDPFYLGGEAFFTWATTAEGVSEWLTDSATYAHVTVEYAVVAYEKYIGGIALSEVIHLITVTVDTTSTTYLIELYGGTTLATMDANNQLIDERYHIAVAQVDENGNILPLETTTATTTE